MIRSLFSLFSAIALLAIMLPPVSADFDCEDPLGCVQVLPGDPIVVGAMLVISGAINYLGEDTLGGVELALLDRDYTLLDRDIELVVEDSLCTAEGGQAAAQRLAADPTVAGAIGTNCSSAAQGAIPIISENGMVMISPTNTSPSLTNEDIASGGSHRPGYFRTSQNGLLEGMQIAHFARRALKAQSLATVHDGDPYTSGLARAVADTFASLEGDVVFEGAVNKGDVDMSSILTEIAVHQPDIIYLPLFEPESNFFTAQMLYIAGLEDSTIIGGAASFSSTFPENTGEAAIGTYVSGPLVSGSAYEELLVQWEDEYGSDPPSGYHAHAYDAINLLLNALESVALDLEDGSLIFGRQAIREAIAATDNFPGLTGALTCREESPFAGDCASGSAIAVFELTEAEVYDDNWPPPIAWNFAVDKFD